MTICPKTKTQIKTFLPEVSAEEEAWGVVKAEWEWEWDEDFVTGTTCNLIKWERVQKPSSFIIKKYTHKMEKCIAIPMENGKLCAHFGHCQYFAFVTVVDSKITDIKELVPPEHVPGLYPRWVAGFGATDVIAGGMGQKAIDLFNQQNINAFVGGPMKGAKEIVEDFLADKLTLNANYCHHDENHSCEH
jgi:predicted Fe-Mo cluster-binding NifX family protein